MPQGVVQVVVTQHAEEGGLLWLQHALAVDAPHYTLKDLAELDERLDAHLDGLRIARADGWKACLAELKWAEPGELFPAAVPAWESGKAGRVRTVIAAATKSYECSRALVSSLGWLSDEQAQPYIDQLLGHSRAFQRRLGIAACAVRGRDPGEWLGKALASRDHLLKARALRAIGELARRDLLPAASAALRSRDPHVRFSAAWSLARLSHDLEPIREPSRRAGQSRPWDTLLRAPRCPAPRTAQNRDSPGRFSDRLLAAITVLKKTVESRSPDESRALQMVLRRMETAAAARWLNGLSQDSRSMREAVTGAGIVGTPDAVGWLLEMMAVPALARVAGEAFTMITGVDLAAEKLEGEWPEGFSAGPTEDPADDNVEMDQDENLPWPDAAKLAAWWEKRRGDFVPGVRHLCGRPLTEDWLEHVLRHGYQRQRAAAALELSLRRPEEPLFNVRAPGHRQQELLGLRPMPQVAELPDSAARE
jgi:hypothetical protein